MASVQPDNSFNAGSDAFKWKHFSHEIILWAVRWYCQFALSYRDLVLMMEERGLSASHTTLMRWVHQYAPEIEKRVKRHLKVTNDSWKVDETYIKIKGQWRYLYRAVDSKGDTLDWMLSETRDQEAAAKFFRKVLDNEHCFQPRVVNADKNAAYPPAFETCKQTKIFSEDVTLRQTKYLNNRVEQDHRFVKRRIAYCQWLQSFETAKATIAGYEAMHMIRKGQVKKPGYQSASSQVQFIEELFGIAA